MGFGWRIYFRAVFSATPISRDIPPALLPFATKSFIVTINPLLIIWLPPSSIRHTERIADFKAWVNFCPTQLYSGGYTFAMGSDSLGKFVLPVWISGGSADTEFFNPHMNNGNHTKSTGVFNWDGIKMVGTFVSTILIPSHSVKQRGKGSDFWYLKSEIATACIA